MGASMRNRLCDEGSFRVSDAHECRLFLSFCFPLNFWLLSKRSSSSSKKKYMQRLARYAYIHLISRKKRTKLRLIATTPSQTHICAHTNKQLEFKTQTYIKYFSLSRTAISLKSNTLNKSPGVTAGWFLNGVRYDTDPTWNERTGENGRVSMLPRGVYVCCSNEWMRMQEEILCALLGLLKPILQRMHSRSAIRRWVCIVYVQSYNPTIVHNYILLFAE